MKPLTTFSGVSFSGGPWCEYATDRGRGRRGMSYLALGTKLTDPPPRPRHPPLTLGWHTLVSKPSLRLPSAGKPARIRKFHLSQFISKTTFKSQAERCVKDLLTGTHRVTGWGKAEEMGAGANNKVWYVKRTNLYPSLLLPTGSWLSTNVVF